MDTYKMPARIWVTREESLWPGFRSFKASSLDHGDEYPEYVRADLVKEALTSVLGGCEKPRCPECDGWGEVSRGSEVVPCRCHGKYRYTPSPEKMDAARDALAKAEGN